MNYRKHAEKLSKRENWTDELIYVHRTRILIGVVLGLIYGLLFGWLIFGR